ncbi:hypothetical protein LEP1GSC047_0524 [Leptospira inadai serovar Lyme str. 10]|uniref:Uncharacterized protein n=1 Tax=Leptospira inadai serovar Lyme str. 10 TaxID=1049790 RepID=V6H9C6_9LEPT|nr:hypothetical protein [Leptospira inadai]EQA35726.1 hypothetical protein LEP1GSC047_0524 [Leptospira inadai serovar Lyme str. 10]
MKPSSISQVMALFRAPNSSMSRLSKLSGEGDGQYVISIHSQAESL